MKKGSLIVFDMDNTLVDEFGATLRPGILSLLRVIHKDYSLVLWTNSTRDRAKTILREHALIQFFDKFIYREDYDPKNAGKQKDCTRLPAAFIIDDDPAEIAFNKKLGVPGYLISPYRKSASGRDFTEELMTIKGLIYGK